MSNSKTCVHAAISKDNWIKVFNYVHSRMADQAVAEDFGVGSFFDAATRTWFMEKFIVEAEYEDEESSKRGTMFTIKTSAKLVLARLKDMAADMIMWSTVDGMVDALDKTDSPIKLGQELRTLEPVTTQRCGCLSDNVLARATINFNAAGNVGCVWGRSNNANDFQLSHFKLSYSNWKNLVL